MFNKVLIANRGEMALRVICACKELGIPTVAVYSQADASSLHVRFADEAVCIGPPRPTASYLNIASIISAAEITGADAVHPGYGLLAQAPGFAEVCQTCGISFIGPSPEIIRLMGNKSAARQAMQVAGLKVLPGSEGIVRTPDEASEWADSVGYPVMLKAAGGGGVRGMRCVQNQSEMASAFLAATRDASAAFGTDELYVEKFIPNARMIEFQILADHLGNAVHLGERECSIQSRFQKLLEEAPSPAISSERREQVGANLVRILTGMGYSSAGTVEFLMDPDGRLYFVEMNTRIQVEHPVTEKVTGMDLVKAQILVASGAPLREVIPDPVLLRGHSLECRITAESPFTLTPSFGKIRSFHPPGGPGVRVDTACHAEYVVDPHYDLLLAKVITHGANRDEAVLRMSRALEMFIIEGVETTLPLHRRILSEPRFLTGEYQIGLLENPISPAALVQQ